MLHAAFKSLMGRKVRLLMSTFAVVLGVAFVAGTLVFTDTLNRSFTALFASTVGDVIVEPVVEEGGGGTDPAAAQADASTVEASLVKQLAKVDGAARADGNVLDTAVFVIDRNGKALATVGAPALGSNWTGAPAGHGLQGLQIVSGRPPENKDEVVFDRLTAERSGYTLNQEVTLVTGSKTEPIRATMVGIADFVEGGSFSGATWVAFDTRTAQKRFLEGKKRFHSIWVTAAPGVSQEELRSRVQAELPAGVVARTGDEVSDEAASALLKAISFLTTFLLIFAGISLVVGAFLIVNTFSILVAQRSRELALLRALGASRRQVTSSVLFEAVVLGVLGSTIGVGLGIVMAMVIRSLFGQIGLDLSGQALVMKPRTFIASYVVGILVTTVAAWFPARRTSRIAPVQAMRDDVAMPESSLRNRFLGGVLLAAVGGGLLYAGLVGLVPRAGWFVGGGILLILLGVAAASPVISQPFLVAARGFFGALMGSVGHLAGQNSLRNPRRTTATASALMIGLALAGTMAIVGQSAKASVDAAIAQNFRGDYVVSNVAGQPFSTKIARRMAKVEGVTDVVAQRFTVSELLADGRQVGMIAAKPKDLGGLLGVAMLEGSLDDLGSDTVILSESFARDEGLAIGDVYEAQVNGQEAYYAVAGVFEDNPVLVFPVVTTPKAFLEAGLPDRDSFLVVDVDRPGAVVEAQVRQVVAELPTVSVMDQNAYAEQQREPIDQMVLMIFALLGLALLIAVLGIVNTLALSVIERTREIGLLRAIGLERRQLRRMITVESVVIAMLGAGLGVGLGVGFGIALMHSLRDQGLEIIAVPWDQLGIFLAVALVVGVLAAVVPARRAARLAVLDAIATD